MTPSERNRDYDGAAALGISESLLVALVDLKLFTEQQMRDVLVDVVAANEEAASESPTPERHRAVAETIRRILDGKDGTRP